MGLVGNYNVLSKSPGLQFAGTKVSCDRSNMGKSGASRNRFQVFARFASTPLGYVPPYTWSPAQGDGGMASFTRIGMQLDGGAQASGGVNVGASITGTVVVTSAQLGLIVQAVAALTAAGTIAPFGMTGIIAAAASLSATGTMTPAVLGALASSLASLTAMLTATASTMRAVGNMTADILPYTALSPEALARAVWSENLATYAASGSAGKKVNDLSGGGASLSDIEDAVWNALLADHQVTGSIADRINKLVTLGQHLALK